MAVKQRPAYSVSTTFWKRVFGQLSRYDLVLTAIPVLFVLAILAHVTLAVPATAAIASGAVVSLFILADAIYINPPVDKR